MLAGVSAVLRSLILRNAFEHIRRKFPEIDIIRLNHPCCGTVKAYTGIFVQERNVRSVGNAIELSVMAIASGTRVEPDK